MIPARGKILLAFREGEALTRQQALEKSGVKDYNEFRHLVDGAYLETTQWRVNWPREYRITPRGIDKRDRYQSVADLIHG